MPFKEITELADKVQHTLDLLRGSIEAKCWGSIEVDVSDIGFLQDKMDDEVWRNLYGIDPTEKRAKMISDGIAQT